MVEKNVCQTSNGDIKNTPLVAEHQALHATFVNFAGWHMPLHYGSQLAEHHQVRQDAGIFDISHMLAIDIEGREATSFLRKLLANDVKKLSNFQALYSCLLNRQAGIMDDLIVYKLDQNHYRCVVNAATAQKDVNWFLDVAKSYQANLSPRYDLAIIAIQGPHALAKIQSLLPAYAITTLSHFRLIHKNQWLIAHTGYTGEEGVEIILPHKEAILLWQQAIKAGIKPIGLGARDTLRLEAGLNLYGQDMDETVSPDVSHLAWTVDLKDPTRDFIGKEALLIQRQAGIVQALVGVKLSQGICRKGMLLYAQDKIIGKLTSGSFSPTLSCGIGFARIIKDNYSLIEVDIRGKKMPIEIVTLPFITSVRKQGSKK